MPKRYAAVEGGGTSWVVAISEDRPDNIIERQDFPTLTPNETLASVREWLRSRTFLAIGIATFGPVDAKIGSKTFGYITSTPKPNWGNTDVLRGLGLKDELAHIPFRFDTDVNAPALAEYKFYQQPGQTSCAYITVGTGIGVGLIINGKSVHGLLHPEAGHIQVAREEGDSFGGTCPFHGSCIEGMCSTGALAARANCLAADLPLIADDDKLWDTCAYYLAQLCVSLILIASPERIVIGGGVMNRATLYPKIRAKTAELLKGYIQQDRITSSQIDEYIKEPLWGSNSGIVGAAYLAQLAAEENDTRTP